MQCNNLRDLREGPGDRLGDGVAVGFSTRVGPDGARLLVAQIIVQTIDASVHLVCVNCRKIKK